MFGIMLFFFLEKKRDRVLFYGCFELNTTSMNQLTRSETETLHIWFIFSPKESFICKLYFSDLILYFTIRNKLHVAIIHSEDLFSIQNYMIFHVQGTMTEIKGLNSKKEIASLCSVLLPFTVACCYENDLTVHEAFLEKENPKFLRIRVHIHSHLKMQV